jgi:hypothetical protein
VFYSVFKVLVGGGFPLKADPQIARWGLLKEKKLDRRPCLTGGAKRLSIYYSVRDPTGKKFFTGEKKSFH